MARRLPTRFLTLRYLLTLALLGGLALANYLILHAQIEINRTLAEVVASSGQQRTSLQQCALLAQKLVATGDPVERQKVRDELDDAVNQLESTHHALIQSDRSGGPPELVRDIYFDAPWLLDTEMRNYIAQLRSLAIADDEDLNWGNPKVRYIDQAVLSGTMLKALSAVVAANQRRSDEKNAYLQNLALWSFGSTGAVLLLSGVFVFRPMVRRVRADMVSLRQWNDSLEQRVAERTAEAEQQADELAASEAKLRDQRRILASILDNMGDGVVVVDNGGTFQLFNPRAREVLNIAATAELPGAWSEDWPSQFDLELCRADGRSRFPMEEFPLMRAVLGESIDRAEVCVRRHGGDEMAWLSISARPLRDQDTRIHGGVAVLRDVTERKAAEDALRKSEALFRSLVDNLPLYVHRKDLEGRFTWVNQRLCKLLGKPEEQILGRTDFDFYPQAMAEKYRGDDEQVVRGGEVFRGIEAHRAASGEEIHVEVLKTPIRGAEGRIIEIQSVFLDVTARIEAERRLMQSERLAGIGQMMAGVAHESRNALQQIQACVGLLWWRLESDTESKELLTDLKKAQDRLQRLFDDLGGYAAPVRLEVRNCDLLDIAAEAWRALAPARQGRLASFERQRGSFRCMADPLKLEQVFRIMMENSLAACDDPMTIDATVRRDEIEGRPAWCIELRDNGPGFKPEARARAFEAFFSTKTQGSGLGMAIARRIVEAHGGEIEIADVPHGAAVRIVLPQGDL